MTTIKNSRLSVSAMLLLLPVLAAAAPKGSETICHVPPGNSENAHTLVVSAAALPAHLAHGDLLGACPTACQANGGTCSSNAECCSDYCGGGTCSTPCSQNGSACATGGDCCSGHCNAGTCATPCAANGGACTDGGDCCSGQCNSNLCVPPCTPNDGSCGTGADCCSGICEGGVCKAPCAGEGDGCGTNSDCCTGICTETWKTCASECTIGPEWGAPNCSTALDCCEGEGICIFGACYRDDGSGFTCKRLGETCDEFNGSFCCFDASCACVDAECTARACVDMSVPN